MPDIVTPPRDTVFISKATPGDDEFVLWLAPRLEAAGYTVYADIVRLDPGMRWRQELTATLQSRAIKMLLCCQDSSLARNGVQEEIGIAEDLVKELGDKEFIIPLRLKPYKKVFGIGELQYVDFSGSWADGLKEVLDKLEKDNVPRDTAFIRINPHWEQYRQRNAIAIRPEPEPLTSNWLRIIEVPDTIRYFMPRGAIDHAQFAKAVGKFKYHGSVYERGFYTPRSCGPRACALWAARLDGEARCRVLGKCGPLCAHGGRSDRFKTQGVPERASRRLPKVG